MAPLRTQKAQSTAGSLDPAVVRFRRIDSPQPTTPPASWRQQPPGKGVGTFHHALPRRAIVAFGALAVLGLSGWGQAQPASAMSCFTVATKMTCIEAGIAPPASFMPPVIVPNGVGTEGEDRHVVIEEDGGRRVASG
jgi:hypothetical protein